MPCWICVLVVLGGVPEIKSVAPGGQFVTPLERLDERGTYRATVSLEGVVSSGSQIRVTLAAPGGVALAKTLHAGDPDVFWSFRPGGAGDGTIAVVADGVNPAPIEVRVEWGRREVDTDADRAAIEAEPNDSWREANPLVLGRAVHGSADDVDDLDNPDEGRLGLDWFRFDVPAGSPKLAFFFLELLDRDISANLRVYRLNPAGDGVDLDETGKDPTEVVHDREWICSSALAKSFP